MSYLLEQLGDERFQQLCQALLTRSFPNVQCLPVGQPDGGRDAFSRRRIRTEQNPLIVFQVKFVKNPQTRDARELIEDVIKSERPKVERLIAKGAIAYHLLTNVSGTSHLDTGSIDRVNSLLAETFQIEAHCWWRDDLERRIDAFPSIKWSYPEVIRATDLLQVLVENGPGNRPRIDALRAYMAHQFKYDAQLKFKQIDLQKSIVDLFVDIPARVLAPTDSEGRARWAERLISPSLHEVLLGDRPPSFSDDIDERSQPQLSGALALLVRSDFAKSFPLVVIEGAPGQGKSTITQYLCQINRMILLPQLSDLSRVAREHRPTEVRIPFRVDLRDYASWIVGRDPFSDDPRAKLPDNCSPLLESFLAAQVRRYTGMSFSVDDLASVAKCSQILMVLDGFDEVADIPTRNRMVDEISDSATRLRANALSLQAIVTSRPAAFANSPGFSRDDWQHVQILSLSRPAIDAYARKWLDARGANERERRDVRGVLSQKLKQSHVRDLARNPMQLTILLALISVQGASLPDKRTALYDRYVDIFFNREAEKSEIVRDHRDLLIKIHQYLAWTLQVEAETNSGSGNIAETRLRELLCEYLDRAGHDTSLIDALFTGVMERVVALVSRIQGTFEFEVQPLREYFAARYLYDTAPYSPSGAQKRGTLPYRFAAIAQNFYWLNVTRFYAGCYSSGELSSLIDGLDELEISEQFKYISHSRQLGLSLLSDYVFSQHPRLVEKLASKVTSEPLFRILLANSYRDRPGGEIQLPPKGGRPTLVDVCKRILANRPTADTQLIASRVLIANCPYEELHDFWCSLKGGSTDDQWIALGADLGIIGKLPTEDSLELLDKYGEAVLPELLGNSRIETLDLRPALYGRMVELIFDDPESDNLYPYFGRDAEQNAKYSLISYFSAMFNPYVYADFDDAPKEMPAHELIERAVPTPQAEGGLVQLASTLNDTALPFPRGYIELLDELLSLKVEAWREGCVLFSRLIEATREIWGDRWAIYRMAVAAVVRSDTSVQPAEKWKLVDRHVPLCDRAIRARAGAEDFAWWRTQLASTRASDALTLQFVLLCLITWAPVKIILRLSTEISAAFDSLPPEYWRRLAAAVRMIYLRDRESQTSDTSFEIDSLPPEMSPRLASLICYIAAPIASRTVYERYLDGYKGDDRAILEICVFVCMRGLRGNSKNWKRSLATISYAYMRGVTEFGLPRYGRSHKSGFDIPISGARHICLNATQYPLLLVGLAESILTTHTGAEAVPVGHIAAHDQWFADD